MKPDTGKLERRSVIAAIFTGMLVAVAPFLFWRSFLRQLPLTDTGTATLSDRFEELETMHDDASDGMNSSRLRELLPNPANSVSVDRISGVIRLYEEETGRAFEIHPTTLHVTPLSESRLPRFDHTLWSPNGTEVITLFQEDSGSQFRYYDYRTARVAALPANVRMIAFSRSGDRILTSQETSAGTELWISKPDGTEAWRFLITRLNVVQIFWPDDDMVVLRTLRKDGREDLVAFDRETNLTHLLEGYPEMDVRWSPNGAQALISYVTDERGMVLSLFDAEHRIIRELPVTARASKCAWHTGSSEITCGVPAQTTSASRDTITSVDVRTDVLSVRYTAPDDVWIGLQEPAVLPRGNGVVFVNVYDKRPYLITW